MARFRLRDGTLVDGVALCSVDGATVRPCLTLEVLLRREAARQNPRVCVKPMVNAHHALSREAVVLDLGAQSLWPFAYCPFCGGAITTMFVSDAAPTGGAA